MRLVLVMVGLPARGKTWVARHVARYLRWLGTDVRVFNVGETRRAQVGARIPHAFFDPDNPAGMAARRRAAETTLDALAAWLDDDRIAIYDATNTTRTRRRWVADRCRALGATVGFVELSCRDPAVIDRNIRETKLLSPDYRDLPADEAIADFRQRIRHYERVYEPLGDDEAPWIRIEEGGVRVTLHGVHDALPRKVVDLLVHLRVGPRPLWLTRHGESAFNVAGRIGGDAPLSPAGEVYARSLARFVEGIDDLHVWSSTLRRARQTARALSRPFTAVRALAEIDAGICDGLTYAEIAARHPEEFAARRADKLRYRYPGGESYLDVIDRLAPVVLDIARSPHPLLIVSHQAVLRALLGYYLDVPAEEIPHQEVPLHTVIALTPRGYGFDVETVPLPPAVAGTPSG